jgi:hypothetical protein
MAHEGVGLPDERVEGLGVEGLAVALELALSSAIAEIPSARDSTAFNQPSVFPPKQQRVWNKERTI